MLPLVELWVTCLETVATITMDMEETMVVDGVLEEVGGALEEVGGVPVDAVAPAAPAPAPELLQVST